MFRIVWQARAKDKESNDGHSMIDRIGVTTSAAARLAIRKLEQLIEMMESWTDACPVELTDMVKPNCARCMAVEWDLTPEVAVVRITTRGEAPC